MAYLLAPLRSAAIHPLMFGAVSSKSVIRNLAVVRWLSKRKHETNQADDQHREQHKSRPVKGKLEARGQPPAVMTKNENLGPRKLKPDTNCQGNSDKHSTNQSERSYLHARVAAERKRSPMSVGSKATHLDGCSNDRRNSDCQGGTLIRCIWWFGASIIYHSSRLVGTLPEIQTRSPRRQIQQVQRANYSAATKDEMTTSRKPR
jgi:hypothetical protein